MVFSVWGVGSGVRVFSDAPVDVVDSLSKVDFSTNTEVDLGIFGVEDEVVHWGLECKRSIWVLARALVSGWRQSDLLG